jgi:hypothetical protein
MQSGVVLFEDSYVIVVDADNREVGDSIGIEQYLALRHVAFKSGKFGLPQHTPSHVSAGGAYEQRYSLVQAIVTILTIIVCDGWRGAQGCSRATSGRLPGNAKRADHCDRGPRWRTLPQSIVQAPCQSLTYQAGGLISER